MKTYFLWLAKFISVMIIMVVFLPLLIVTISKFGKDPASPAETKNRVAIVELTGPIMSAKDVLQELHKQIKNDKVQGIVLRIDSPGGLVAPSQEIFQTVQNLKKIKPIVVSMGSVAASGGLYASLGAAKIFAQAGTNTGSIGVVAQIPNFSKIAEKVGVDFWTVKSGELKDVGNPTREITEKDKQFMQSLVLEIYDQFLTDVATARNLDKEQVRKFADGRVLLGSQALEYGLIDSIGDVYDASREIYNILDKPLPEGEYPELLYKDEKFNKLIKFLEAVFELPIKILNKDLLFNQKVELLLY